MIGGQRRVKQNLDSWQIFARRYAVSLLICKAAAVNGPPGGTSPVGPSTLPTATLAALAIVSAIAIFGMCCAKRKKPISSTSPRRSEPAPLPLAMHSTAAACDTAVSATNPMREARPLRASQVDVVISSPHAGGLGLAAGVSGLPPTGIVDPVSESLAYARSSTNPLQRAQLHLQQQSQIITPARPSVRTRTGSASIRSPASTSAPPRGRGESGAHLAPDIAAPHPTPPPEVVVVDAQPEGCSSHEGGGISSSSASSATESAVAIARIEQPDSGRALDARPAVQAAPVFVSQRSRGARGRGGSDAVLRARPPPVVVDVTAASPEDSMRQFAHRRPSPCQVAQATADPMHGSAVGPVPPVSVALGAPAPALFRAPADQRASLDTEEVVGSLGRVPTRFRLPRRGAVAGPAPAAGASGEQE